jgi:hypothetical protein
MDWVKDGRDSYDILKEAFDAAYGGNRAPLPIFIHTSWFAGHLPGMLRFMGGWQQRQFCCWPAV